MGTCLFENFRGKDWQAMEHKSGAGQAQTKNQDSGATLPCWLMLDIACGGQELPDNQSVNVNPSQSRDKWNKSSDHATHEDKNMSSQAHTRNMYHRINDNE